MARLVMTFVGDDRPGLVNAMSEAIASHGGTWLESRSARLAGKYAGILLVGIADGEVVPLEAALAKLLPKGLRVSIDHGALEAEPPGRLIKLDVVGQERPGIVRDVTEALTKLGVNIEEFTSGLEGAPFTGETMFRAAARLSAPEGVKSADIRKALEQLAGEIMVDLTVGEEGAPA
jgi:glycine cleavage system regulatory protein